MTSSSLESLDRVKPEVRPLASESVPLSLLLITLLALMIRLFRLGESSLWIDELITLWQGTVLGDSLWRQFLDDHQSPLPMVIASWMSHVSQSEAWLRLPAALLGSLTPVLIYGVGLRTVGRRAGLFAALLLAVQPLHVYHSQEVRGYAYLVFFGLAATWVALEAAPRPRARDIFAVVTLGVAATLSNLQGLFWMAGLGLGLIVGGRVGLRDLPRWSVVFVLILAFTSPWWGASLGIHESERLIPGEETGPSLRGETTFSKWSIPYAAFSLTAGPTLAPSSRELHELSEAGGTPFLAPRHIPWVGLATAVAAILAVAGAIRMRWRSAELLAWGSVAVALAVWMALRNVKPLNPRYVICVLPALLLWFGAGLDLLPRRVGAALLVAWLALSMVGLWRLYDDPDYRHEDVRGAAELIQARESRDDTVLVPTVFRVFAHYYRGINPIHNFHREQAVDRSTARAVVTDLSPDRRFVWYVRARPWHDDPAGHLQEFLDSNYELDARFELPGVEVLLYDREVRGERP